MSKISKSDQILDFTTSSHLLQGRRQAMEDFVLVDNQRGVFAVADGFGGKGLGNQAAKIACDATAEFLKREGGDEDATLPFEMRKYYSLTANILLNAVLHASRRVFQSKRVAGCSLVSAYVEFNHCAIASIGTCSATLVREGKSQRIVVPQSYGRFLDPTNESWVSGADGMDAPMMALGVQEDIEPQLVEFRLHPGDLLVLHSDGFSVDLQDQAIQAWVSQDTATERFGALKELLESADFEDNSSILLINF